MSSPLAFPSNKCSPHASLMPSTVAMSVMGRAYAPPSRRRLRGAHTCPTHSACSYAGDHTWWEKHPSKNVALGSTMMPALVTSLLRLVSGSVSAKSMASPRLLGVCLS